MASKKENILIIKHGALGDFILSFGPFKAIRNHHLNDRIFLLTTNKFKEFAEESNCFDEIFQSNSGMKLNWDEPGYLDVIDIFLDYPVLKILTYRKNIFEKVISEMLAIQTGHWIQPIGRSRKYKNIL